MKKLLIFLSMLLIGITMTACTTPTFNGSRAGNDSQFILEYSILNKMDYQLLELEKDDVVQANIVSKSGRVNVEVAYEDGEVIYSQANAPTSSFELTISKSGTYTVTVTGEKAKGSVSFIKETN